jgi:hypothetical protein
MVVEHKKEKGETWFSLFQIPFPSEFSLVEDVNFVSVTSK